MDAFVPIFLLVSTAGLTFTILGMIYSRYE
jgi:hypothetical protein